MRPIRTRTTDPLNEPEEIGHPASVQEIVRDHMPWLLACTTDDECRRRLFSRFRDPETVSALARFIDTLAHTPSTREDCGCGASEAHVSSQHGEPVVETLRVRTRKTGPILVASLQFRKDIFTKKDASHWAYEHGFKKEPVEESRSYWRIHQHDDPTPGTFRTRTIRDGVLATFAQFPAAAKPGHRYGRFSTSK